MASFRKRRRRSVRPYGHSDNTFEMLDDTEQDSSPFSVPENPTTLDQTSTLPPAMSWDVLKSQATVWTPNNTESEVVHKAVNELDTQDRKKYLEVIDKIRETGVTKDISLPQLVVVGDQSSGKSSLLEGITGLAFPVSGDICTRFATQIILSRCAPEQAAARISIIPGPTNASNEKAKTHLDKFKRVIKCDEFEYSALGEILSEASVHLGLPVVGANRGNDEVPDKRFSDDVVRIELAGPDQNQLSVVDVPGLFHNPTKHQTAVDKDIIRGLIKQYLAEERTIIMAVCDATSNLANQEVFTLAREADPEGQRTVGIVTKCDAVQPGDESTTMDIAMNNYEHLKHGWFVAKNRSTKDIIEGVTVNQRHERERVFFTSTKPWSTLPASRQGVSALKSFLAKLLSDHIHAEFPGLVRDLQSLYDQSAAELAQLGNARQTTAEQRQYLCDVASAYERRVEDVLGGSYDRTTRQYPALKLRKRLRDLEADFADRMRKEGHTYIFKTTRDKHDKEFLTYGDDLGDDIYQWIRELYLDNRGVELPGMINPAVLRVAFQEQSVQWEEIALQFFNEVSNMIRDFNHHLLEVFVMDPDVRRDIDVYLEVQSEDAFQNARGSLMQCLTDERENILKTENDYYSQTLAKCRRDRITARLQSIGVSDEFPKSTKLHELVNVTDLKNEDEAVNSIHDALKAFYKVAIKRFTDHVILGPIETALFGQHGPVRAFNPRFVNTLADEKLASMAAETSLTSAARSDAKARTERLEQALSMAKNMSR